MAKIAKRRGKYVADFYEPSGRRIRKSFQLRKDAESFLLEQARKSREARTGVKVPKKAIFREYSEAWFKTHSPSLKPSTQDYYRRILDNHLVSRMGHLPLSEIDRETVNLLKADMAGQEKWSNTTINHVVKAVKKILGDAVLDGYLEANTALAVKLLPSAGNEMDFLNPEELKLLLEKASPKYRPLFLCAALSGIRRGEILAIHWDDVDFRNHQIHIRRSLYRGKFLEPKSSSSRRSVDIAPMLVETLKELPSRFRNGLVFCQKNGKPLHAENMVKREFRPALRRAGLRMVSFHALRHSYAAMLIEAGAHPKYIQKQLGHASIRVTLDTYGHLMRDTNREASERLQEIFLGNFGHKMVTKKAVTGEESQ